MQKRSKQIKHIIFTGGGSAGHVTPNIALIDKFKAQGWQVSYIGSKLGIEKELIFKLDVPYYAISSGKLRRYFSWQNFIDPFKVLFGILQSIFLCHKLKPKVIFAKGGFVSLPVVIAAWLNRIPVFIHESDLTPGLANKLGFPFVDKIFVTFPDTLNYFKNKNKIIVSGTPIRAELLAGSAKTGREICGFDQNKKAILVYGGSLGAEVINTTLRKLLPELLRHFQVAHICGKGKVDTNYDNYTGYKQFEYLSAEFPHVMAVADLVISRSGANTVYELLILRKPHILIPLGKRSSRGDQIDNAKHFAKLGLSEVIFEEQLTAQKLLDEILLVNGNLPTIINKLNQFETLDSTNIIYNYLVNYART